MNQIKFDASTAQPAALESAAGKPYYEIVRDELARNIATGRLWPGVVLLEGPIATRAGRQPRAGQAGVGTSGRGRV